MIAIVCIDNQRGMLFHSRRQSQDRNLRADVLREASGGRLWMNEYSARQFEKPADQLLVAEDFLQQAGLGDYCFVENQALLPFQKKLERVILYAWNRAYPADFFLDIPLHEAPWHLAASAAFPGSSHEKITKEVYVK